MKDLLRLLVYGGGAAAVIGLLSLLATDRLVSANTLVVISVLLVIVLPVALGILLGRRERLQRDKSAE
jgi:ABC-type proline/glycine betaine transport system permease subunit